MKLNNETFKNLKDYALRAMSEYHSPGKLLFYGAFCDKQKRTIFMLSPYFAVEIENVDMDEFVSDEKPFYNSALDEFTSYPYEAPIEVIMSEMGEFNPIGHTTYSATDIIRIMDKAKKEVFNRTSRYVFAQGFLPEGTAPIKFRAGQDGRPFFSMPNANKEFIISEYSTIPEQYIIPERSYACRLNDVGSHYTIDVVEMFGKTKSGLVISEECFDPANLDSINSFEGLYSELMVCSNTLEIADGAVMPPIHLGSLLFYDILKIFMSCKNPVFNLVFQEAVNSRVILENVPEGEDDIAIRVHVATLNQEYGFQRG